MFPALRPLLNKGGAGRYISREESVERLLPIAERHLDLLATYDRALLGVSGAARENLDAMMPYLRTEVAKVSETILSLGGTPPSGIHREPLAKADGGEQSQLKALLDGETAFGRGLREEIDSVHHQERTRAILGHNAEASDSRVELLRGLVNRG